MADVVLINPPRRRARHRRPSNTSEPHLGLASIAACLKQAGYKTRYIDGDAEGLSADQTAARAVAERPLWVGLTAPTALVKSANDVALAIKSRGLSAPVALGGYHATVMPRESVDEFKAFDCAFSGEGEEAAVELSRALDSGLPATSVSGIVTRKSRETETINPSITVRRVDDLDGLPFPAWDEFPLDRYQAHYRTNRDILELPVNAGRGCPGRCHFCARISGDTVRRRNPERVVDEIEYDLDRFGAGAIVFMDETFSARKDVVHAVCEDILRRGLEKRFYWLCQTRADTVDRTLLDLMRRAGCRTIAIGVESGDSEVLRGSGKGTSQEKLLAAMSHARAAGIEVDSFFILGLPGDTPASMRRTVDFAVKMDPDFANFFVLVPYPGTRIFDMARSGEGGLRLLSTDWDDYGIQMGAALEQKHLSRSKLNRTQLLAYLRFYFRPKRWRSMVRMVNPRMVPVYIWHLMTQSMRSLWIKTAQV